MFKIERLQPDVFLRCSIDGLPLTNCLNMQLMALIGEQFDETEDICGIVASVRARGDKLALWTRTASNEAVQVGWF